MKEQLLKLQKEIHANAVAKGFWANNPSKEQMLMLVITEIAEVVEADRMDMRVKAIDLEIYKKATGSIIAYPIVIKGTIEEELADVAIRLLDYMAGFGIILDEDELFIYINGKLINHSLSKQMFYLTVIVGESLNYDLTISSTLGALFSIANSLDIDLIWHIKEKKRYNESRQMLHNKKY